MFELFLALVLGILTGTFTGLIPGLHINLVIPFLLALFSLAFFPSLPLAVFIVSVSITHVFLDFLPSIYLGAPDDSSGLAVLPGHALLLQGKAKDAVSFSLYGCASGIVIFLLFAPFFIFILPEIYLYLSKVMLFLLLFAVSYLLITEKNKLSAVFIFLLAGFLGLASLNLSVKEPLLPLFSGLFGASALLVSVSKKTKIPVQEKKAEKIKLKKLSLPFLASVLSAPLCSFLPALGSSQAAVIGSNLVEEKSEKSFLFMLGSINVSVMALSFLALFSISKTRTGSAYFLKEILPASPNSFILPVILTAIMSGVLAFFLAFYISKYFSMLLSRINYSAISILILVFISVVVFLFSGFLGFVIYAVSCSLGLLAIFLNIRRTHLLGCLMVPAIIFYL